MLTHEPNGEQEFSIRFTVPRYTEKDNGKNEGKLTMTIQPLWAKQATARTLFSYMRKNTISETELTEMLDDYAKWWLFDRCGVPTYPILEKEEQ